MTIKRNTLTLVLVLVLGLTLFTAATVAAGSTTAGYETFKETMKDFSDEEATGGNIKVTVDDNGDEIFSLVGEGVGTKDTEEFSADLTVSDGDLTKVLEVYGLEEAVYLIDVADGGYYTFDGEDEDFEHSRRDKDDDRDMTATEEELLDWLVGDLKDNFIVEDLSDGGQSLSFTMEDSEVPTGLNLMLKAGAAADHRSDDFEDSEDLPEFFEDFDFDSKPELVEDVQLDLLSINLILDSQGNATELDLKVSYSGKEADGTYHEVTVKVDGQFTYEDIQPETIDVEAYDWEVIKSDKEGHGRR